MTWQISPSCAAISGIDPDRINLITWGISGGLGALGGVFFASYTQLYPAMWVIGDGERLIELVEPGFADGSYVLAHFGVGLEQVGEYG